VLLFPQPVIPWALFPLPRTSRPSRIPLPAVAYSAVPPHFLLAVFAARGAGQEETCTTGGPCDARRGPPLALRRRTGVGALLAPARPHPGGHVGGDGGRHRRHL